MSLVQGIFCPLCKQLLYKLERATPAEGWTHTGPPLRKDGDGHYLICRSCNTHIPLRKARGLPGWGFEVDHDSLPSKPRR
jgi:uncharacterized protein YbaR (Trm112 family)